ncbi:unnamed protein product [Diplocarpon coronariae]
MTQLPRRLGGRAPPATASFRPSGLRLEGFPTARHPGRYLSSLQTLPEQRPTLSNLPFRPSIPRSKAERPCSTARARRRIAVGGTRPSAPLASRGWLARDTSSLLGVASSASALTRRIPRRSQSGCALSACQAFPQAIKQLCSLNEHGITCFGASPRPPARLRA